MDERTLRGANKDIYVLMKIMRYVMDSEVKSYDCKYAVEMFFGNNKASGDSLGKELKAVMEYKTLRGKFDDHNVHQELRKLGVTEIVLMDDQVHFKGIFKNLMIEK